MAKTRTAQNTVSNVSLEQATESAKQYAKACTDLATIEAKMNPRLDKIKAEYQEQILECETHKAKAVPVLEQYAKQEKDKWTKKSMEFLQVVIGFRTATPSVSKTKFTWDAILELVKKNKYLKSFVRTKEELNKQAILDCKDEKILKHLPEVYIEIEQKETFYVDLKKEKIVD